LLLNASSPSARLVPPNWERVQRMLSDTGFRSRVLSFDARTLREKPAISEYVAAEYFRPAGGDGSAASRRSSLPERGRSTSSIGGSDPLRMAASDFLKRSRTKASMGRSSTKLLGLSVLDEPLTFQRVSRASRAAAALFSWSTTVLLEACAPPLPLEEVEPIVEIEPELEVEAEAPAPASPVSPLLDDDFDATPVIIRGASPLSPAAAPGAPDRLAQRPDRHFELLVPFDMGSARLIDEGEFHLQTIAAAWCMRQRLRLHLEGSPAKIESDALGKARLTAVQEHLLDNGIFPDQVHIGCKPRYISQDEQTGVICELRLDDDRVLFNYYLMIAEGMSPKEAGTRDTLNFSSWLEENFHMCKH